MEFNENEFIYVDRRDEILKQFSQDLIIKFIEINIKKLDKLQT